MSLAGSVVVGAGTTGRANPGMAAFAVEDAAGVGTGASPPICEDPTCSKNRGSISTTCSGVIRPLHSASWLSDMAASGATATGWPSASLTRTLRKRNSIRLVFVNRTMASSTVTVKPLSSALRLRAIGAANGASEIGPLSRRT